jgi:uncharacterized protein (TIGR03118 family)
VDGKLFVTFAKQKGPDNEDDESGPGNGFVDVFNPDGKLLDHFAARGALNSPWGIASVPDRGFRHLDHSILIGNFGDGRINIFDKEGKYRGQLSDSAGHPITIPGLWGLMFRSPAKHTRGEQAGERLFFTAGPNDENDGVFGYLKDLK